MKFEVVNRDTIGRGYKYCRVQRMVEEFHQMDCNAVRCVLEDGEYANMASAQSSLSSTIKKLGYRMRARVIEGNLYLIKLD